VEETPDSSQEPEESGQDLTPNEPTPSASDFVGVGGAQPRFEMVDYQGPLPPPAMLNDYNSVLPGLAARIVQMAENEQSQAHRMQRWYAVSRFTGQGAAFIIAFAGLVVGGLLINSGHNIAGLATLFGGLGPVVGAFLYRQIKGNGD
jgi:uncharacterized membrane protein